MSDLVKVALLTVCAVAVLGAIVLFPIMGYISLDAFGAGIITLVQYAGQAFIFGRGLINNLLSPWARGAVTGLMAWFLGKWFYTYPLQVMVGVYHYFFK